MTGRAALWNSSAVDAVTAFFGVFLAIMTGKVMRAFVYTRSSALD